MDSIEARYFDSFTTSTDAKATLLTLRLAHSIPFSAREQLMRYRLRCNEDLGHAGTRELRDARLFAYWDLMLDLSPGPRWLEHPRIADAGMRTLRDVNGVLCRVLHAVVLPTHLHVLYGACESKAGSPAIEGLAEALKVPIAHMAAPLLRPGTPFWDEHVHVHSLQGEEQIERSRHYLRQEPVRSGLVRQAEEWRWCLSAE